MGIKKNFYRKHLRWAILLELYLTKYFIWRGVSIMDNSEILLSNLHKVHTTEMGIDRIKKNLNLDIDDVVEWCKTKIKDSNCSISRKGKNWYAVVDNCIITVNAYSYTIITAHKVKKIKM
jgi:uncharacterized membrane protein